MHASVIHVMRIIISKAMDAFVLVLVYHIIWMVMCGDEERKL